MGTKYRTYSLLSERQGCRHARVVPVKYQGRAEFWCLQAALSRDPPQKGMAGAVPSLVSLWKSFQGLRLLTVLCGGISTGEASRPCRGRRREVLAPDT